MAALFPLLFRTLFSIIEHDDDDYDDVVVDDYSTHREKDILIPFPVLKKVLLHAFCMHSVCFSSPSSSSSSLILSLFLLSSFFFSSLSLHSYFRLFSSRNYMSLTLSLSLPCFTVKV